MFEKYFYKMYFFKRARVNIGHGVFAKPSIMGSILTHPLSFMQVVFSQGLLFRARKVLQVFLAPRGILESLGMFMQGPRDPMGTKETEAYLGIRGPLDRLKTEVGWSSH